MGDITHDSARHPVRVGGGSVPHGMWAPPPYPTELGTAFTLPHQDPVVLLCCMKIGTKKPVGTDARRNGTTALWGSHWLDHRLPAASKATDSDADVRDDVQAPTFPAWMETWVEENIDSGQGKDQDFRKSLPG